MPTRKVRTTLALPPGLLEAADREVTEGRAESRNEIIAEALERELKRRHRERLDAEIAAMADDPEEMREIEQISREFEQADWEAWVAAGEPPYPYPVPEPGRAASA